VELSVDPDGTTICLTEKEVINILTAAVNDFIMAVYVMAIIKILVWLNGFAGEIGN
jgi:hypothetical protein